MQFSQHELSEVESSKYVNLGDKHEEYADGTTYHLE